MVLVVTSCSSRKAVRPAPQLRAAALPFGCLAEVSAEWKGRVKDAEPHLPASALYRGRGFSLAASVAEAAGGTLRVVSAGLGLIDGDCPIPGYGLTVSLKVSDSVLSRIDDSVTAADWWRAIRAGDKRQIDEGCDSLVLVAMSSGYLRMIADDLASMAAFDAGRLRIFTGAAFSDVDPRLRNVVLGYDKRLDGPDSPVPGTKADFAQRALYHFMTTILPISHSGNFNEHNQRVFSALAGWSAPTKRSGQRKPDEEIKELMSKHWSRVEGNSHRMLRLLRDELAVACEQARFRDLFAQVQSEQTT